MDVMWVVQCVREGSEQGVVATSLKRRDGDGDNAERQLRVFGLDGWTGCGGLEGRSSGQDGKCGIIPVVAVLISAIRLWSLLR